MQASTTKKRAKVFKGRAQYAKGEQAYAMKLNKNQVTMNEIAFDLLYPKGGQAEFEKDAVTYNLKAGDVAMHHPSLPHKSMPNSSPSRWRRIIILRYLPATFPKPVGKFHQHWATGELYQKHSYLVSGEDVDKQGFAVCPQAPDLSMYRGGPGRPTAQPMATEEGGW